MRNVSTQHSKCFCTTRNDDKDPGCCKLHHVLSQASITYIDALSDIFTISPGMSPTCKIAAGQGRPDQIQTDSFVLGWSSLYT
jgi:hypothetical protein